MRGDRIHRSSWLLLWNFQPFGNPANLEGSISTRTPLASTAAACALDCVIAGWRPAMTRAFGSRATKGRPTMLHRTFMRIEFAAFGGIVAVVLAAAAFAAEYQMTVNRDRLLNAQNEPQNWLLMNGDYGATRYSKLTQISRDKGENVWDKQVAGKTEFGRVEKFLTAPLVADGKVIVQNGAGDGGTRGWVAALEVRTGKELWRWYVVPKPGDPGSETWKDDHNAWKTGGGGIWQTGSYDPATKLYIVGTGNPFPIYDPQARPGDNLYTDSAVALNVDTGKPAWHFQYTPNDSWDYDEVGVHMLYDATVNREQRQIVGHFGRHRF